MKNGRRGKKLKFLPRKKNVFLYVLLVGKKSRISRTRGLVEQADEGRMVVELKGDVDVFVGAHCKKKEKRVSGIRKRTTSRRHYFQRTRSTIEPILKPKQR